MFPPAVPKFKRSKQPRTRLQFENLESRCLLSTLSLNSAGPLSSVTVGSDGSFQVQLSTPGTSGGQVYPGTGTPGDAGLFLRQLDGTVNGLDLLGRAGQAQSRAQDTHSQALHPLAFTRTDPNGALQTTLIADNQGDGNTLGDSFQTIEVVTYRPGDSWFRVDTTIVNLGASTLRLDGFQAADLHLAGSDSGVGYRDPTTGAVGGLSLSGSERGFVQTNSTGGASASNFQAGDYRNIWQAIGAGAGFALDSTVNLPVGGAPYNGDPSNVDNGVGLQWQSLAIDPHQVARFSAFWSFGATGPVKTEPAPAGTPRNLTAAIGKTQTQTVAQFSLPAGVKDAQGYQALIVWGDGSLPEYGKITPQAASYSVTASHAYHTPGKYPVSVSIVGPGGGATVVKSSVTVPDSPDVVLALAGTLAKSSDHGVSSSDGVTNVATPGFSGQGTPGGTVQLVAQALASPKLAPITLGSAIVNSQGTWAVNSQQALPDGSYTVLATIQLGTLQNRATLMATSHPLVIDTQGPSISQFTATIRQGKIVLKVTDAGSGLDLGSIANAPQASLGLPQGKSVRILMIMPTLAPGAASPMAKLVLQAKPTVSLGRLFALSITGSLQDRAGNLLDGTYTRAFPTGSHQPGTPFQVLVRTDGTRIRSITAWNGSTKAL